MVLTGVTFLGPELAEDDALDRLIPSHRALLTELNGFIAFRGGLHLRGIGRMPSWHDLDAVWTGSFALHTLFDEVRPGDVPFAQDFRGDQFLLREGRVQRLEVKSGALQDLKLDLDQFLNAARLEPVDFLDLQPLWAFLAQGGVLRPGRVLDAEDGVSGQAPTLPALSALRHRARALNDALQSAG